MVKPSTAPLLCFPSVATACAIRLAVTVRTGTTGCCGLWGLRFEVLDAGEGIEFSLRRDYYAPVFPIFLETLLKRLWFTSNEIHWEAVCAIFYHRINRPLSKLHSIV